MSRPTPSATETLGARFAAAIEARDRTALRGLFATPVEFRAVTPAQVLGRRDAVRRRGHRARHLVRREQAGHRTSDLVEDDTVGGVSKISYRMSVATESGPAVVEQVAYYRVEDGRITYVRLVCSGFRPV